MKNEVFISGGLSATAFSLITAILLFTLFAIVGGILVRRAGWKMLPALTVFLLLAILRGALPLEITRAMVIHYPEAVSDAYYTLREPRLYTLSVLDMIFLLWLSGAAISFLILLWKMLRQHRAIRKIYENAPDAVKDVFCSICTEVGIRKTGIIFSGDTISSPMMVGFFRPIVLLPKRCEYLPEEELSLILRHELAHYRYRDLWKKLALSLFCCVFWWNPAAYFLRRSATQMQELRADAYACAGVDEETRLNYAETLLNALKSRPNKEVVAAGYFNNASERYLKQRFNEILQFTQTKRKTVLAWIAVALALVVFFGSYSVNFQPIYTPNDDEKYTYDEYSPNQFILDIGNGMYQLYSDGKWIATLSEDDLASEQYSSLPIYNASVNAN